MKHTLALAEINTLYQTSHFSAFVLRGNRAIDPRHVEELKAKIKRNGFLPSQHITVRREGTELVVADGQHRLLAATELGVPVWFVIDNEVTPDMTVVINATQKGWELTDYLKWFAEERQIPDYLAFRAFLQDAKFPISICLGLAVGNAAYSGNGTTQKFKKGEFVFSHREHAYFVAQRVRDFAPYFKAYRQSPFVAAVVRLMAHPQYDHARMMAKMEYQSTRLVKCPDVDSYVSLLQDIYNHRTQAASRINFLMTG
jgi:hypothetical protein